MSAEFKESSRERDEKIQLRVDAARDHLNSSSEAYYGIINRNDAEDFEEYMGKMSPLRSFSSDNPKRVVSIGVGSGLEVHSIRALFPEPTTEVIGLDLSDKAIAFAREYLDNNNVDAELVQGSATELPFKKEGKLVDGMVYSSILHEVYSYVPDGKKAWSESIAQAATNLNTNGTILIRDFAAPIMTKDVEVGFRTKDAHQFYQFYRDRYRTFETWDEDDRESMIDRRTDNNDYPDAAKGKEVVLPFSQAAEFMLHYRNHINAVNGSLITPRDKAWKEMDETYLIPDPDASGNEVMSPYVYMDKVAEIGNAALSESDSKLECVLPQITPRPSTARSLMRHFSLHQEGIHDASMLFNQIPAKMDIVFKRARRQ